MTARVTQPGSGAGRDQTPSAHCQSQSAHSPSLPWSSVHTQLHSLICNRTSGPGSWPTVKFPALQDQGGQAPITSLQSTRPAARPPGAPCTGGRWARSLCRAGVQAVAPEEGRRAPAKCSSGPASLNPSSYPWSRTRLNPFHRREGRRDLRSRQRSRSPARTQLPPDFKTSPPAHH